MEGPAEFMFPSIDPGATGKHIYYLLASRGYKARDAARILGFSDPQAVYNWKYGSRMPSIDNLDRLSRLLHISINDLLVHDGDEEVILYLQAGPGGLAYGIFLCVRPD